MTSEFSHLMVFAGVIIALAVTRILNFAVRITQYHRKVKIYWLHLIWVVTLFLLQIQWWRGILVAGRITDSFGSFFMTLLYPITLYAASAFLVPEVKDDSPDNLIKEYYFDHGKLFFITGALALAIVAINSILFGDDTYWAWASIFRYIGVILVLVLAWLFRGKASRTKLWHIVHGTLSILALIMVIVHILTFTW